MELEVGQLPVGADFIVEGTVVRRAGGKGDAVQVILTGNPVGVLVLVPQDAVVSLTGTTSPNYARGRKRAQR
jgi:hypothetical protein